MTLCVDISPHCSALFGTRLLSMHFHDIALISCCGLRRECAAALFSDTGSTQNPPCLSLSKSKYPSVANIFIQILNIFYFFSSSPFIPFSSFFHFVQLSIVMQPLLSSPKPPFSDLPEILSGIITRSSSLSGIITLLIHDPLKNSSEQSSFFWNVCPKIFFRNLNFQNLPKAPECEKKFLSNFLPPGTSLKISLRANVDSKWD